MNWQLSAYCHVAKPRAPAYTMSVGGWVSEWGACICLSQISELLESSSKCSLLYMPISFVASIEITSNLFKAFCLKVSLYWFMTRTVAVLVWISVNSRSGLEDSIHIFAINSVHIFGWSTLEQPQYSARGLTYRGDLRRCSDTPQMMFLTSCLFTFSLFSEMLQFVSNQVGDFPDLFEDQMNSAGSLQGGGVTSTPRPQPQIAQTPQTPQPSTNAAYQSSNACFTSSQTLSPHSVLLTPPLTPAQTPSPPTNASVQQQVTRSPPLLQPRPQMVQPIQPQPQQAAQTTIQVQIYLTLSHTLLIQSY